MKHPMGGLIFEFVFVFFQFKTTNVISVSLFDRSDTAILYNDRSVLESHHVSAAYRLLQDDDEMNILYNLSKDDWRSLMQTLPLSRENSQRHERRQAKQTRFSDLKHQSQVRTSPDQTFGELESFKGSTTLLKILYGNTKRQN